MSKLEINEIFVFIVGKKKEMFYVDPLEIMQKFKPEMSKSQIKRLIAQGGVSWYQRMKR